MAKNAKLAVDTSLKQKDKELVRRDRQVQHSKEQIQKLSDKAQKQVAQAQAKTFVVRDEVKELTGALEVKIPSPTSQIIWMFLWLYTPIN